MESTPSPDNLLPSIPHLLASFHYQIKHGSAATSISTLHANSESSLPISPLQTQVIQFLSHLPITSGHLVSLTFIHHVRDFQCPSFCYFSALFSTFWGKLKTCGLIILMKSSLVFHDFTLSITSSWLSSDQVRSAPYALSTPCCPYRLETQMKSRLI